MNTISSDTYAVLAHLSEFPGNFAAARETIARLKSSAGLLELAVSFHVSDDGKLKADKQVQLAEELGVTILSPFDDRYPVLLFNTHDYPPLLWVKGLLPVSSTKSIAVIGPREPTQHGAVIAYRIARHFAEAGWSVVSGLAVGCDSAAHIGALDAKGHTVAVMAHGLQTVSPKTNQALADRILNEGGALVSQYPIGIHPSGRQYVQRDRTQAGLSQGVVMVQSDLNGGSLHAPRASLQYGRWLAVPYPTETDIASKAPKILANMVITLGIEADKCALLQCPSSALQRIVIINGKEDYDALAATLLSEKNGSQTQLF